MMDASDTGEQAVAVKAGARTGGTEGKTEVGNYFVSNYPPFSFWDPEHVGKVLETLEGEAPAQLDLGLYLHVPFCRKRCHFCYFRVYTDKNAGEIKLYLDAA
ncbi:MAG: hypothetical protein ACC661_07370, partial [Verrucomicrobiales bacterium]